jgi:hypothetical protein
MSRIGRGLLAVFLRLGIEPNYLHCALWIRSLIHRMDTSMESTPGPASRSKALTTG